MKIAEKLQKSRFFTKTAKSGQGKKGIALVTVLTIMALTTILVITFFSLASSEHQATSTYSHGLQAQQVAEQAVNVVIAQIRKGTLGYDENSGSTAQKYAWASQPGMIRTWEGGDFSKGYKLYSDETMVVSNPSDLDNDFGDIKINWSEKTEEFVDLNEPVIRGEKVYYPIVNPGASVVPDWPKAIGRDNNGVEGFRFNFDNAHEIADKTSLGRKGAERLSSSLGTTVEHLAMPVKWIYQLADGTLGALDSNKKFSPFSGGGMPKKINPIVARFAFWADDETSKLNLNTHAGGLAWDVPRAAGALDMDMAKYQPAQHEWQRYPGHPATTHLIPVLAPGVLDIVNDREAMEMLFEVVPRVVGGGSESGTRVLNTNSAEEENGLVPDKDPLLPSVDDMVMKADRTTHEFPNADGSSIKEDELSEYLERSKFFLTVHSRAPETNLFNQPRVAIWPVYDAQYGTEDYKNKNDAGYLTKFDRLIHFCSSMGDSGGGGYGGYPRYDYIFRRKNADSTTEDYSGIQRNQELYKYLLGFLNSDVPGYGAKFSSKYPQDTEQILTQIFDYIRSTNLHDDTLFANFEEAYVEDNTSSHRTFTNPRSSRNKAYGHKGHGQVVPIRIGAGGVPAGANPASSDTKGFGRFFHVNGATIHVICCADGYPISEARTAYAGARSYRNQNNKPSSGSIFTNFPPIPSDRPPSGGNPEFRIRQQDFANRNSGALAKQMVQRWWPKWLYDLALAAENGAQGAQERYDAAFDPRNWNWQLAFLDPEFVRRYVTLIDESSGAMPSSRGIVVSPATTSDPPMTARYEPRLLSPFPFADGITRLRADEKLVQGILLFNYFTPSVGWTGINADMEVEVKFDSGNGFSSYDYRVHTSMPEPDMDGWLPAPIGPISGETRPYGRRVDIDNDSAIDAVEYDDYDIGAGTWVTRLGPSSDPDDSYKSMKQVKFLPDDDRYHNSIAGPGKWIWSTNWIQGSWGMAPYGGVMPFDYTLSGRHHREYRRYLGIDDSNIGVSGGRSRITPLDGHYTHTHINNSYGSMSPNYTLIDLVKEMNPTYNNSEASEAANGYRYDLVTIPFKIKTQYEPSLQVSGVDDVANEDNSLGPVVHFGEMNLQLRVFTGGEKAEGSEPQIGRASAGVKSSNQELIQQVKLRLPEFRVRPPQMIHGQSAYYNEFGSLARQSFGPLEMASLTRDGGNRYSNTSAGNVANEAKTEFQNQGSQPTKGRLGTLNMHHRHGLFSVNNNPNNGDVVRSVGLGHGDARLVAGRVNIGSGSSPFSPHKNYNDGTKRIAHAIGTTFGGEYAGYDAGAEGRIVPNTNYNRKTPLAIYDENSSSIQRHGDFDNGPGLMIDGAYINKPDEGNTNSLKSKYQQDSYDQWDQLRNYGNYPYFVHQWRHESGGPAYFSPNRIVSGPGVFGSLPTGVKEGVPWRTLLFRPNVVGNGYDSHKGAGKKQGESDPPDHFIMDLFWMPVVEPYAISEPLSTAGKVNMNFAMEPFRHIERTTALRGVMRSEFVLCVPNRWSRDYKHNTGRGRGYHWRDAPFGGELQGRRLRSVIVDDKTLDQFWDEYFDQGEIFKSASQICEIHLVTEEIAERLGITSHRARIGTYEPTVEQMEDGTFWRDHSLVGDNSRERPYTNIHQRLTTKSNTFKVHYRAQVLQQSRRDSDGDYETWDPALDTVQAEYRGSSIVERYVDPDDPSIPDYATDSSAEPLDKFYKFRVLNPTRFAP